MLFRRMCIAALVCTSACTPRAPAPSHPLRWARAWLDSLNSHRWEEVGPLLGEHGTYEDSLSGGPLDSVAAAFHWYRIWAKYPDLHYELSRITGDGYTVAAEWRAEGWATPETVVTGLFLLTVDGDSITSVRGYYTAGAFIRGPVAASTILESILIAAASRAGDQRQPARRM